MKNEINEVVDKLLEKGRTKDAWGHDILQVDFDGFKKELVKKLNSTIEENYTKKEVLLEKIEVLDLEFAIDTDVIEKKTGKKVEMPKEVKDLWDIYQEYIFKRLREELLNSKEKA